MKVLKIYSKLCVSQKKKKNAKKSGIFANNYSWICEDSSLIRGIVCDKSEIFPL